MKKINEIFYSLQGEGRHTGRAAIFIRFSGCNLKCSFCDTDFKDYQEMSDEDILYKVEELRKDKIKDAGQPKPMIILTGGEPTMQVDGAFIDMFHAADYFVAMESNGTKEPPKQLDWLTVSPKEHVKVAQCDELKCIFDGEHQVDTFGIKAYYYYLQPCDTGDAQRNQEILSACVAYIEQHPKWRLSLQTHKLIGFK